MSAATTPQSKPTASPSKWNPLHQLKRLYDWTLKWADHRYNVRIMAGLSAIESIFFPVPVDPLMMAMCVATPKRSLRYATIMTLSSVGGAVAGYYIGHAFWATTQDFFLGYVFSPEIFEAVKTKFQENEVMAIILASFTPLPFKVFTVTAGVAELSLPTFIISCLAGRGARFFIVGGLMYYFGKPIKALIEKYFNLLAVVFAVILLAGYYLIPHILK